MDPSAYSRKLSAMVIRYGERLWRLRVMEAEIRVSVRTSVDGRETAVRFVVSNESGYFLNIHVYRESFDPLTGCSPSPTADRRPHQLPLRGQPQEWRSTARPVRLGPLSFLF
jgi:hypothetical protein